MLYPLLPALLLGALWLLFTIFGVRRIVKGARAAGDPQQSLIVIQGFRRLILGGGFLCFSLGFALEENWLHLLGAVFLLEELVETQLMRWAASRER
jgi:hypothetical protein